jgi:hypothetical protein
MEINNKGKLSNVLLKYNLASITGHNGILGYKDNNFHVIGNDFKSARLEGFNMEGYELSSFGVSNKIELLYKISYDLQVLFNENECIEGNYFIGYDDGNTFKVEMK